MSTLSIITVVVVCLFLEIALTYFTIEYCCWTTGSAPDDACILILSWWVWVFVIPYALVKKPVLWLVEKLK